MALNLDDLWIGDPVLIRSTNENGIFSGLSDSGKAIIKVEEVSKEIEASNLEEAIPEIENPLAKIKVDENEQSVNIETVANFINEIDLHLEKLSPGKTSSQFISVLDFQLSKCRYFIQQAIANKAARITIIHGKGEGKLKQAVEFLLLEFDEVSIKSVTNDGGAIEVWLK